MFTFLIVLAKFSANDLVDHGAGFIAGMIGLIELAIWAATIYNIIRL